MLCGLVAKEFDVLSRDCRYSGVSGLSSSNAGTLTAQNSRPAVSVYADENAMPSLLPEQNEEYANVPLTEVIERENQLRPGRWNDARVSVLTH